MSSSSPGPPRFDPSPEQGSDWRPLVTCCLATFLLLAFTTVVTVSAGNVASRLGAGFATAQWIIDGYTLALAALVMAMGTLGDRWGHRRLFLVGLIVFGVASAGCGGLEWQPPGRGARRPGHGRCGDLRNRRSAVDPALPTPHARNRIRCLGNGCEVGSTTGTIAGGAVTQFISWRWLFLGALPICLVAVIIGGQSLSRGVRCAPDSTSRE